jgi:hypothetical protein
MIPMKITSIFLVSLKSLQPGKWQTVYLSDPLSINKQDKVYDDITPSSTKQKLTQGKL